MSNIQQEIKRQDRLRRIAVSTVRSTQREHNTWPRRMNYQATGKFTMSPWPSNMGLGISRSMANAMQIMTGEYPTTFGRK